MKRKLSELVAKNILESQCVISSKTNVLLAAKTLKEYKSEAAIVLRNDDIAGIITEKDIFNCFTSNEFLKVYEMTVEDIMSKKVICVDLSYTLEECIYIMCKLKIHHLPIVDVDKKIPFSLISLKQIANIIIDEKQFEINQLVKYITGSNTFTSQPAEFRNHREIEF